MGLDPKPCKLFTNGIFAGKAWEQAMAAIVTAGGVFEGAWYHYDAEAILTGWWANQHADGLADAIKAQLSAGAPFVDLFAHSEGNDVTIRMFQRHPELKGKVRVFYACAAALADDCDANGMNAAISSGMVRQIICMFSKNDGVCGSWLQWFTPFFWGKSEGAHGPKNPSPEVSPYWKDDEKHMHWTDGDLGNSSGCNAATVQYVLDNPAATKGTP